MNFNDIFVDNNLSMGTRVSKQEVTKEHFLFKKVSVKSEYGKELIVTTKPFMDDEYAEWKMKYDEMRLISNKQFMLLPEEERREEIKKEFMCCECPADIELSVMLT